MTKMVMPTRRTVLAGLSAAMTQPLSAAGSPTHVLVIASMHGRHATSTSYTYDDLYRAVAAFAPDHVGVEIRAEDLPRPDDYLARNYPREMIALARRYGDRAFGFDWLGDALAGRAIPDDWWRTHDPVKKLEREVGDDPAMTTPHRQALAARLSRLSDVQGAILDGATVSSFNDERYDRVTASYYRTLAAMTRGTRFAALPRAYAMRDGHIDDNVVAAVRRWPGTRIVVVTGGDHRGALVRRLGALGRAVVVDRP